MRIEHNSILERLDPDARQRLAPHLREVTFGLGDEIYGISRAPANLYFPLSGIVSVLILLEDGRSGEVALVGHEGVLGLTGLMDGNSAAALQSTVQCPGHGLRLPMDEAYEELARGGEFLRMVLYYGQSLLTQIGQTSVCNRYHHLEEQLARWLLMCQDRLEDGAAEVFMTQESMANMLGVRREGVCAVARRFQQDELISYRRGKIRLLDRKGLEQRACECYRVLKKAYHWTASIPKAGIGNGGPRQLVL